MDIDGYIDDIKAQFEKHSNSENKSFMEAYMKHQFVCYGIKRPERNTIQKPYLLKDKLPKIENLDSLARRLWRQPNREFKYFCIDLLVKYHKLVTHLHFRGDLGRTIHHEHVDWRECNGIPQLGGDLEVFLLLFQTSRVEGVDLGVFATGSR